MGYYVRHMRAVRGAASDAAATVGWHDGPRGDLLVCMFLELALGPQQVRGRAHQFG